MDAKNYSFISLHTIIWSLHSRFCGVANCCKTCSSKFSPLILSIWSKIVSFCMIIIKVPRKPKKTLEYFIFVHSRKAPKIISERDHSNLDQFAWSGTTGSQTTVSWWNLGLSLLEDNEILLVVVHFIVFILGPNRNANDVKIG